MHWNILLTTTRMLFVQLLFKELFTFSPKTLVWNVRKSLEFYRVIICLLSTNKSQKCVCTLKSYLGVGFRMTALTFTTTLLLTSQSAQGHAQLQWIEKVNKFASFFFWSKQILRKFRNEADRQQWRERSSSFKNIQSNIYWMLQRWIPNIARSSWSCHVVWKPSRLNPVQT